MTMIVRTICAILVGTVLLGGAAFAQPFPNRPIRILVTIPPGGAPDISARMLAQSLSETLGWSVVIENRPGANGNIASEQVAKSAPDGYTLLLHADSGITINPHVYAKLPFDALKDLLPVASVATNQFMLSLNPQVPVKTFPEFIEYARKTTPALPYASGGNGSQHQLMMEMLKQRAKIDLLHVPFRGAAPATTATVAGDTKVLFSGSASASLIQSGQLRAVATSGKKRAARFPDLPTIGEFYPGYAVDIWLGLFAPAGTPAEIVRRWNGEVMRVMQSPEIQARLPVDGARFTSNTPEQFSAFVKSEITKWAPVVKASGARVD
jgi:tripartite-type tricarboxylate transporter receptor subunit TctC